MKNATIEKMKKMRLYGMMRVYEMLYNNQNYQEVTVDEAVGNMVDAEWDERYNRKLTRLLKQSGLRYQASIEQLDFSKQRNLNRDLIMRLSLCSWIVQGKNIVITGKTGSGKSYLACAFGHQACISEYKVRYFSCLKIWDDFKFAKAEGTYEKKMKKLKKVNLIILDDFGLKIMDTQSRLILLELLEDRYENHSTIISTQLPPDKWHEVIGDPTIADAVCDRIIHRSYKINIKGKESMRKIKNNSGNKLHPLVD